MATRTEKSKLIRIAAALKPVVIVGASGPSDSVLTEIERALTDPEHIMIRLGEVDR
ncbi:MAG: YhbY family RNA-binding protein, partial [Gammaproteobacteria bacterium]